MRKLWIILTADFKFMRFLVEWGSLLYDSGGGDAVETV